MSRLEEIKYEVAREKGFTNWASLFTAGGYEYIQKRMEDVNKRYARECCIATQKACADNATLWCQSSINGTEFDKIVLHEGEDVEETITVFKESITKPDNIVLL